MPGFSVSCSQKLHDILLKNDVSPSKAFQLGIEIISKGGIDQFEKSIKEINILKNQVENLEIKLEQADKRNENLKEMLNKTRNEKIKLSERIEKVKKEKGVPKPSPKRKTGQNPEKNVKDPLEHDF